VAGVGLDADHLNRRVAFLHGLQDAHGRSCSAERHHHDVDLAIGLVVDFRTGMKVVGGRIRRTVELVGHEIEVRVLAHKMIHLFNGAVRPLVARRQQQLRPESLEDFLPLEAGRFRHRQDNAVSLDRRHHGQADAGVAAGGLDDDLGGRQDALPFGGLDEGEGWSVFYRATGVLGLPFSVKRDLRVGIQTIDPNQRCIADGF